MINKKPLIKFLIWSITLFFIIFIGISNVFALEYNTTYNDTQTYYDNNGNSVSSVGSTWNESLQSYVSNPITTTANSFGAGVVINSPIPILGGHTYSLSIPFTNISYDLALSSKNRIAIGNDIFGTAYNYSNSNYYANTLYSKVVNGKTLQFAFSSSGAANYIFIPWTTSQTHTQSYFLNSFIIEDLGSSGGVSESTINNSLNNQTNIINNSILASQNEITTNSDNNRDLIINNQNANNDALIENDNSNTQKIIDENKKNFNDCHDSVNLLNNNDLVLFSNNRYVASNLDYSTKGVIVIKPNQQYILSLTNGTITDSKIYLFDNNMTLLTNFSASRSFTTPNNAKYLSFYATSGNVFSGNKYAQLQEGSVITEYESYGEEICVNKLDEQKNAINNVDNTLKDDNVDDNGVADAFESFNDYLDDNSTITQLITLPITLYTAILNNLNGACSPFNLGELYGESLILPCINISQYLGNSLWTMIDIIISGFAVYAISKKMIKVFNNFSSLREGDVIDD